MTSFAYSIKEVSRNEISAEQAKKQLKKLGCGRDEVKDIISLFQENVPHKGIQGKMSRLKLARVIGITAQRKSERRKRELEEIAGKVLFE